MKFVIRHLSLIIGLMLCSAAGPLPELIITKGGTYGGAHSTIAITDTDGGRIIIDRATLTGPGVLINQVTTKPIDLTITNSTLSTTAPNQAVMVWRFTHLDVEHNSLTTGGMMFCNYGSAIDAKILCNRINNISGATGPKSRNKEAAIQFQNCHIPLEIAWNHVSNQPGKSAVEDNISLMLSGGLNDARPAIIHDNFVDGGYSYAGLQYSGSGIMVYDPGSLTTVDATRANCHTLCYSNIVIRIANQHVTAAGGFNFQVYNNRCVNDGSVLPNGGWGFQIWNYNSITPKAMFATQSAVHDNFSFVKQGKGRVDFSIAGPTAQANNVAGTSSDDSEINLWAARCAQEKVCVGPLPLASIPATQPTTQPASK